MRRENVPVPVLEVVSSVRCCNKSYEAWVDLVFPFVGPGEEQSPAGEDDLRLPGWQRWRTDICWRRSDYSYRGRGPGVVGECGLSILTTFWTSGTLKWETIIIFLFLASRSGTLKEIRKEKEYSPCLLCTSWVTDSQKDSHYASLPKLGDPVNSSRNIPCHKTSVLKKKEKKNTKKKPQEGSSSHGCLNPCCTKNVCILPLPVLS